MKNTIDIGHEAGIKHSVCEFYNEELKRFAALVASAEREACAEVCDRFANRMMSAEECADAIRARGQA